MRHFRTILTAALAIATAACSHGAAREAGGDIDVTARGMIDEDWGGDVRGTGGWSNLRGSAYAHHRDDGTRISLTIERGFAGAAYGWGVAEGKCGETTNRALGEPVVYPPLFLDEQGRGAAVGTLTPKLERGKEYVVNVYSTVEPRTTIIACGRLAN